MPSAARSSASRKRDVQLIPLRELRDDELHLFVPDAARLWRTRYPNGRSEERGFNGDGMVVTLQAPGAANDVLTRDAAGRITSAQIGGRDPRTASLRYNGLGHLIRAYGTTVFSAAGVEEFVLDAIGNRTWKRQWNLNPPDHPDPDGIRFMTYAGAGKLEEVASAPTPTGPMYRTSFVYDGSGNQVATWGHETIASGGGTALQLDQTRSYYGPDQKLHVLNRHVGPGASVSNPGGVYEEYRYDALGRRVLVRSRSTASCSSPCKLDYLERTIWAGDQMLVEIRAQGSTSVIESTMESESPASGATNGFPWGRVHYTHGLGIDAPLAITRTGLSGHPSAVTVFPHANWQGEFENGSMADGGLHSGCSGPGCPPITWPAVGMTVDGGRQPGVSASSSWFGSLIAAKTDGSGLQYMRNRYYDPATGRFTQEDPIGLAGGLNLYGYAGGDPVNFSDPFGLWPEWLDNLKDGFRENVEQWKRDGRRRAIRVAMKIIGATEGKRGVADEIEPATRVEQGAIKKERPEGDPEDKDSEGKPASMDALTGVLWLMDNWTRQAEWLRNPRLPTISLPSHGGPKPLFPPPPPFIVVPIIPD